MLPRPLLGAPRHASLPEIPLPNVGSSAMMPDFPALDQRRSRVLWRLWLLASD